MNISRFQQPCRQWLNAVKQINPFGFLLNLGGFLIKESTSFSLTRWTAALLLIQAVVTVPSIFVMNDVGFSFISAISVDHSSMLDSMLVILKPATLYNQMAAYHSSFYGWSYFSLSFLILWPVKLIGRLLHGNDYQTVYIGLKIVHVLYGFLATLSMYQLFRRVAAPWLAFAATLAMVGGTPLFVYGFRFHPEPVALLFINLALIHLHDLYARPPDDRIDRLRYYAVLLCLVLASLAKPSFLLFAAPVYLLSLVVLGHKKGLGPINFILTGGWRLLAASALLAIGVFFVINPYFFLNWHEAITLQIQNTDFQSHASVALPSGWASLRAWGLMLVLQQPLVLFTIVATLLTTGWLLLNRPQGFYAKCLIFLNLAALANVLFTMSMYRVFIVANYLIPEMPVLFLNTVALLNVITKGKRPPPPLAWAAILATVVALAYPAASGNLTDIREHYLYRASAQFKIYDYLKKTLPNGAIVAHDQFVPIPDGKQIKDYHFWQHSPQEIDAAHPDYIVFNVIDKFNGNYGTEKANLIRMTQTEPFHLQKTIFIDNRQIEVWQRN